MALTEAPPARFPQLSTHPAAVPLPPNRLTSLRFPLVPKEQVPSYSSASDHRVGVLPPVGPSLVFPLEGKTCAKVTNSLVSPRVVAGKSQVGLQAQELGIPDVSP